ncbi:880_t:CDS:2 [Scutellospora calospora]|uniref:880_t:CDS:1 n=1 Tax=Scutellospora calospora TaxID=85575 RepID=A0ACA9KK70_9GLOM|nr:880_t:CDS:2 [Scutellospora calospora]
MNKTFYCLLSITVITTILFLGLFFGIGYPEILRNNFTKTTCDATRKWNIPKYCCYEKCDKCIYAPSNATSCYSLKDKWNSIDPTTCNNGCPSIDDSSLCGNGYQCCLESYRQVCPKSGSSYYTQHICESWVTDVRCQIICPFCHNVIIEVKYNTFQGLKISNNTKFFDSDQNDNSINNYMDNYSLTKSFECFYDPKNLYDVFFDVDYTTRTWSIIGLSIFLLYLSLISLTTYLSIKYHAFTKDHWLNFILCLWLGTVPPIIFISVSHTPNVIANILYGISLMLITIFWANVPLVEWSKTIDSNHKVWILVTGTFVLPLLFFEVLLKISSFTKKRKELNYHINDEIEEDLPPPPYDQAIMKK